MLITRHICISIFFLVVTRKQRKENKLKKKGFVLAYSLKIQSIIIGSHGKRSQSHFICNQEAKISMLVRVRQIGASRVSWCLLVPLYLI